jgi:glycosyltransferase involved in cell wall biosynthesis
MTFGVSIVTGTWNRIDLLKSMIQSVRQYTHRGIPLEIVVCDAGSTDGTLEWLSTQSDVVVIADGELRGAISAFTRAAYAAKYDYVLMSNDDVLMIDYSILAALAYLEDHPQCGAVAFADDREAVGKPSGYHVQTMTVLSPEGQTISVPYAQVGLFRRWLGDLCGWWGAYDPQFQSHTYGGDNYLTARILEYGYSVDAVEGVRVKDIVANDSLRVQNIAHEKRTLQQGGGYYQRFTTPPQMQARPLVDNPIKPVGLRTLYLPIFETGTYPHHPLLKRGLREGLASYGAVVEVDYINEPYDLPALVKAWQPDILFTQCQRDLIDLTAAKDEQSEMLCLNWNGDVYLDALITPETLSWLKSNVDVQLVVNGAALPVYEREGVPAAYWQCAYEPVTERIFIAPENAYDIVLMGSAYSDKRRELARVLTSSPYHVGLVGSGWVGEFEPYNAGNSTYEFELSNAIRRSAKIEVGDNQYAQDTGFISNRVFDCLASGGALLLHQTVEQLEEFTGLEMGAHYVAWSDMDDLRKKIDYYMNPKHEAKRAKIVKCAYDYVKSHHSFQARLKQLFTEILPRVLI